MDICMRRLDYEKIFSVINEEKEYGFEPHIRSLREEHNEFSGAVSNSARIAGNKSWRDSYYGCPFVATIDVHPLDVLPRNPEEAQTVKTLIGILWKTRNLILSQRPAEEWIEQLRLFENILPFRNCVPAKDCMSVEDYCEPSVLRLRIMQPYVPLRRNIKRERV